MSDTIKTKGIKETADLVEFIVVGISTALVAGRDGYSLGDLGAALSLLDEAKDALKGLDQVPGELADLDAVEVETLTRLVAEKLIIPPSKATELIPYALRMAAPIFSIIAIIRSQDKEEVGS